MTDTHESGHWFHRTSEKIQRWLAEEPASTLDGVALEAVIGAGGVPVRDEETGHFRLHPRDAEYIRELDRAGVDPDNEVR